MWGAGGSACEALLQIWTHTSASHAGCQSHCCHRNISNQWVWIWWLWKRRNPGTFFWLWVPLEPVPQSEQHHDHCLRERPRNVVLAIIISRTEFDITVVMLFLTLTSFMKLKYTDKKGLLISFLKFIVLIVKTKVQDSSSKASISRVCDGRSGPWSRWRCSRRKQENTHCVCSRGAWGLGGGEELMRLWGQWWERLPWTSPGPCLWVMAEFLSERKTVCPVLWKTLTQW